MTASIVGPNTGVAVGEVTSSLLGPFVGFHHQALLIATLWPEGKGNVSSGVNAGANHTSKAPDQEFLPGEGLFLGLGASVKYPADFSRAPYTLIACNVTTLPQQVAFPFSLISVPSARLHDLSLACNQIQPAWMLLENLYCIKRREAKFRTRNQARRTSLQLEVFRPSLVDLMRDSVRRLEAAQPREVYTERDVEGLGKNYLLEEHRLAAIEAYRFFIHHATLLGLKQRLEELLRDGHRGPWDSVLSLPVEGHPWEHQRRILQEFGHVEVASALRLLPEMLEKIARAVESSKAKDDVRGAAIIADYADAHVPAAQDPFVLRTWEETRKLQGEIQQLLFCLEESGIDRRTPSGCPGSPQTNLILVPG